MKIHEIKLREEFADDILSGEKTFEIRRNDRGYQKGDRVKFKVVDAAGFHILHPVETEVYEITYLLHGWGMHDGYCVFGIKPVMEGNE